MTQMFCPHRSKDAPNGNTSAPGGHYLDDKTASEQEAESASHFAE